MPLLSLTPALLRPPPCPSPPALLFAAPNMVKIAIIYYSTYGHVRQLALVSTACPAPRPSGCPAPPFLPS